MNGHRTAPPVLFHDRVTLYALTALVVMVPLVPFNFLSLGLSEHFRVVRYLPFALSAAAILAWWSRGASTGNRTVDGLVKPVGWLLVALLLSAMCSIWPLRSGAKVLYYTATGEGLFLAVAACLFRLQAVKGLVSLTVGVGTVVGLLAAVEGIFGWNPLADHVFVAENPLMSQFSGVAVNQAVSTIGNPNPLGTYLVLCWPLAFALYRERSRNGRASVTLLVALVIAVGLLLTASRGAVVAFFVAASIMAWPKRPWRVALLGIAVACGLLWASAAGVLGAGRLGRVYQDLVLGWQASHRVQSIDHAASIWTRSSLLGIGTGCYVALVEQTGIENDTPDNAYLLWLSESGLTGLGLRLGILGLVLAAIGKAVRAGTGKPASGEDAGRAAVSGDGWLLRGFLASLCAFCVAAGTWDAPYFPVTRIVFWIVAGAGIALAGLSLGESGRCQPAAERDA